MRLYFNGDSVTTHATSLAALLEEREIDTGSVATAVNGDFVPRTRYHEVALEDNMKIEVLAPMQGG